MVTTQPAVNIKGLDCTANGDTFNVLKREKASTHHVQPQNCIEVLCHLRAMTRNMKANIRLQFFGTIKYPFHFVSLTLRKSKENVISASKIPRKGPKHAASLNSRFP